MNEKHKLNNSQIINATALAFALSFLLAAAVFSIVSKEWYSLLRGWRWILITPCPLVTDYFSMAGISATFLNAGICAMVIVGTMYLFKEQSTSNTMAGYFLVIAHCFYGLNLVNMLPCFLASLAFMAIRRMNLKKDLHVAMFSTAFGPFVSELLFRYTQGDDFQVGIMHLTFRGVLLTVLFVALLSVTLPTLLPGAKAWHKGYNLFNGGLAFGIYAFFLYNLLYRSLDHKLPLTLGFLNLNYVRWGQNYQLYANCFFIAVFSTCLLAGFLLNGKSFQGLKVMYQDTGYAGDFAEDYGMPLCLINLGIYGLFFLVYINAAVFLSQGAGFTGPTVGVILAAMTFSCVGMHPRNVWPIIAGYQALYLTAWIVAALQGRNMGWSISTQAYINGVAFATGLCPLAGRYGNRAGIAAGFLCAGLCTATRDLHGGLMLYNGGFTAGLTALVLLPMLEYYFPDQARDRIPSIWDTFPFTLFRKK